MMDVFDRRHIKIEFSFIIVVAALLTITPGLRAADVDEVKAFKVKAAYLYNFAKFVRWPDRVFKNENSPFVIGVLDNERFADIVRATVRDKKINGREIVVQSIEWNRTKQRDNLNRCHIVYVCEDSSQRMKKMLTYLNHDPVLTVSNSSNFTRDGGMIGFVLVQGRIVFDINRQNMRRATLEVSSKLLKLAREVWDE